MPNVNVTILGPNLPLAPSTLHETFHVHATGCRDISRPLYCGATLQRGERWTQDVSSIEEVAEAVYYDMLGSGEVTISEALDDIRFFPCTGF